MVKEISIKTDSIKLDQFIKWAGIVETGGQAKIVIQNNTIRVNGINENRRGKVLHPGDTISIDNYGEFVISKSKEE